MRNEKTENAEVGLKISEIIKMLEDLKEKHGNLPCYVSYDDFYYIPIYEFGFEGEYLAINECRPNELFPDRIVFNPSCD